MLPGPGKDEQRGEAWNASQANALRRS